jgi:hypothetical protein
MECHVTMTNLYVPDEKGTNPGDNGCGLVRRTETEEHRAWWCQNVSEDHRGKIRGCENVDLEKRIGGSESSLDEIERNVDDVFWSRWI